MGRIMLVFCCVMSLVSGWSQQTENPFDLKFRQPRPPVSALPDTFRALQVVPADPITTDSVIRTEPNLQPTSDDNPFDLKEDSVASTGSDVEATKAAPEVVTEKKPVTTKPKSSRGLQVFFLLLSLLLLIFIVNVERSFVKDLWRVISNENYGSLHLRNQRNTMRQILLMMGYLVFILQAGIFLYHILLKFGYSGTLLDNIWTCMALVSVVYIVRHSVISYLRWLFNNDKEMTLFGYDLSVFNIMIGLILLPINVLLNFGPEDLSNVLIYMGIIAAVSAYLMRQLRWLLTARQLIANSLFLFFVYLCAVEILPLWAISKFFW